jgi:2',3'-cyclic-nucleotide 2'-phosphodiesterase (5'-nucleotidase family)
MKSTPSTLLTGILFFLFVGVACTSGVPVHPNTDSPLATTPPPPPPPASVVISLVGTSDLHGHIRSLPVFAGYVNNLRKTRERDHGAVLLLDAGDLFQGTLESNLNEGASVIVLYNALKYDAAAIGNHEFDYGPAGADATPHTENDDPFGALRKRTSEARFPFLSANILEKKTSKPLALPNVFPSTVIEKAGLKIGIIGVSTEDTLRTTISSNVVRLKMKSLAEAVNLEARRLRTSGCDLVILSAHAGGKCTNFSDPKQLDSCEKDQEIVTLAQTLAPSTVNAIVAGHTHQGMAHWVHEIPIIQSYAYGKSFGRIDLTFNTRNKTITETKIFAPQSLCKQGSADEGTCVPSEYEGVAVIPNTHLNDLVKPMMVAAEERKNTKLGVTLQTPFWRDYGKPSPLGDLFADLMLAARPHAQVAITNAGGIRADLPKGELTFGRFYEATPFDNHFAEITMKIRDLADIIAHNLQSKTGLISIAGVQAKATCSHGKLLVSLKDPKGKKLPADKKIVITTNDFLALGGDGILAEIAKRPEAIKIDDQTLVRDGMITALKKKYHQLDAGDTKVFDKAHPKIQFPTSRPVVCSP